MRGIVQSRIYRAAGEPNLRHFEVVRLHGDGSGRRSSNRSAHPGRRLGAELMTMRALSSPRIVGANGEGLHLEYESYRGDGSGSGRLFTDMSIGAPAADRYLLVGVKIFDNSAGTSSTDAVSINPNGAGPAVDCLELVQARFYLNDRSAISWWLTEEVVPTATLATADLDFNSSISDCKCMIYSVTGAELIYLFSKATGTQADPTVLNMDLLESGVACAMARGNNGATVAWSGITEHLENIDGTGLSTAVQEIDETILGQEISATFSGTTERGSAAVCLAPRPADAPFAKSFTNNANGSKYFSRTPAAGNRKRWTLSVWAQLDSLPGIGNYIFTAYTGQNDSNSFFFYRGSTNNLAITGWYTVWWRSQQTITDNHWHHILLSVDTDNPIAADRLKVWVDRTEFTNVPLGGNVGNPGLGFSFAANNAIAHNIGRYIYTGGNAWNGALAQLLFIDGKCIQDASLSHDAFTKSQGGVVYPQNYNGLFGPKDYSLDFANSTDMGNDQSGNDADWTSHGSPDQSLFLPRLYR